MKTFSVTIQGTAPILMSQFSDFAQASIENEVKQVKRKRGTPAEEAEKRAYRLNGPGSELYLPGEAIYQAMVRAGVGYKMVGSGTKTYKDAVKGNVLVNPEFIGLGINQFAVDARRVRIGKGSTEIRYRPRIESWKADFTIQLINEDMIPEETLNAILVKAGQEIGILDYRPRFGRFMVIAFSPIV